MGTRRFFTEMRRRKVWQVAGAYVVGVWMALEIALTTFEVLHAPAWASTLVLILAFLGFPVALVLAWAFDITATGVVRTEALPETGEPVVVHAAPSPGRLAGVFGVGILVALVGFGAYARFGPHRLMPTDPGQIESMAVLPFVDLSEAQDQGYFSDGVTEELLNRLSRVPELQVAGRTSSFAFRNSELGIQEIGQRLHVQAILEGSVRRAGDRLRVTAQLTDVATGYQIWSETYDQESGEIFEIQDGIANAIVSELKLQLSPGDDQPATGTENVRAHDHYLLGLARWHRRTPQDLEKALEYFQLAVEEDPQYARAHAGIAQTYAVLPAYGIVPGPEAVELANTAAATALSIDPQLAEAHAALGQIAQGLEWDLRAAEDAYRRAVEFNPSYATGHQWYAETLILLGRLNEARQEIDRAIQLDPLAPAALHTRAYLLTVEGDYAGADSIYAALLDRSPDFALGWMGRLLNAVAAGDLETARRSIAGAVADDTTGEALRNVVAGLARPAWHDRAVAAAGRLEGRLPTAQQALWYAALDDDTAALRNIERAFVEGNDPNLPFFLVHPIFDEIRSTPRFRAVAEAVGVERIQGVRGR